MIDTTTVLFAFLALGGFIGLVVIAATALVERLVPDEDLRGPWDPRR